MLQARARFFRFLSLFATAWLILAVQPSQAALPQTINYQGYLASSGGTPHNGAVVMTFRLYDAPSGGSALWTEIQPSVTVTNGVFNAVLGSVQALALPFNVPYYVSITVNADGEMAPRQPLASSPYAFRAAVADNAFAQGGNAFGTTATLGTTDNQPVTLIANNVVALRITPDANSPTLVGGYSGNSITNGVAAAVVAGGGTTGTTDPVTGSSCGSSCANRVTDHGGVVGGGVGNQAGDDAGTTSDTPYATVSGGIRNTASSDWSTVGGGYNNTASGNYSVVVGGTGNLASGTVSTVLGGISNIASGVGSTVAGGNNNTASGLNSFAAGNRAKTTDSSGNVHNYSFVWADAVNADFYSMGFNSFNVRAIGGARFVTHVDIVTGATLAGVSVAAGSGTWSSLSDVDAKSDFASVDARAVLASVAALPIRSWRYKSQDASIRHIGPTAQDFRAAFAVGENERTITTVDADGVALAAIQGLNEVVQEKEARIRKLEAALERMQLELERLKAR